MEVVDNLIVIAVPGAMEAGLGSLLFWGSLSFALAVAAVVTVPVNRYLIARGKGHAVVHETGVHGRPRSASSARRRSSPSPSGRWCWWRRLCRERPVLPAPAGPSGSWASHGGSARL
jgi:hypothetical protein